MTLLLAVHRLFGLALHWEKLRGAFIVALVIPIVLLAVADYQIRRRS